MTTLENMETITASLERTLQEFSLNLSGSDSGGVGQSTTSDTPENLKENTDDMLEITSDVDLPYQWKKCLDLKTGEIYYVNWKNGTKAKEEPRKTGNFISGGHYSGEDSSYENEDSSSDSSPSSSYSYRNHGNEGDRVLVVAGCKSCLMYFMVPKTFEECPKCNSLIMHFNRWSGK